MLQTNDPQYLKFHVFEAERFVDLNPYQFGWERCQPLHSFGPYIRNHYLFHFVISGSGTLIANEKRYPVQAKQGFLICPEQVTSYQADEQDPWEYIWLEFDGMQVRESLMLAGLSARKPIWHAVSRDAADLVEARMLEIVNRAEASASPLAIIGCCFLFLDQLVQSSAKRENSSGKRLRDFYVKEAITFIEQNFERDISVHEIAVACGLNRSYFGKIFRESIGESPQQFLLHYRMSKAAQLLKESRLPVREISTRVSYANALNFSRAFKSVYGVSPREYRQRNFIKPNP